MWPRWSKSAPHATRATNCRAGNATLTLQYAWIDGSNASWSRLAATTDRAAPVAELLLAGLARLNGTGDSRVVATNVTLQTSCERVSQLQRLLCASLSVMALSANQVRATAAPVARR